VQYRKSFSIHQNRDQKSAALRSLLPSSLIVNRLHVQEDAAAQKSLFDLAYSHPIWSMPSNTDTKPNYAFCQFINPELAHDGKRCTCFDIVIPKPKTK
jgi:hypothetical protein